MAVPTSAQRPEPGTSTAVWGRWVTAEQLQQAKKDGVNSIEVALNQCYRNIPNEEKIPRMQAMKAAIDSARIQVWSVHLPFSRQLDISVLDDSLRAKNVNIIARMIRISGDLYAPQRMVLHPSSEPIEDKERERRIYNAVASIRTLKAVADETGAVLCIENLPRTCLGNTPEELVRIVDSIPGVGICFDTNHYVHGTTSHFIDVAGERIKTVHMSDFDFVNECHWLPYEGEIDWGAFMRDMREKAGYEGVMMHEVRHIRRDGSPTTTADLREAFEKMYNAYKKTTQNDL